MLSSVALKTLHDQRRGLAAWSVSLILLVAMYVALWPSIRDQPSLADMLDQMPEAFRALFATAGADMSSAVGYLQIELMSFMGPMLLLIYAIGAGAAAVAGEEDRHTLDMLLANPISRARVAVEKLAAMCVGVVWLAAVTAVALIAEGPLADMDLPTGNTFAAMAQMAMLALVFGSVALAVGAATGSAAMARAIPAVVAVLAYFLNGLGPSVSWLAPVQKFSPFYQYIGNDPLRNGLSIPAILVAAGTVVAVAAAGTVAFRFRDVSA